MDKCCQFSKNTFDGFRFRVHYVPSWALKKGHVWWSGTLLRQIFQLTSLYWVIWIDYVLIRHKIVLQSLIYYSCCSFNIVICIWMPLFFWLCYTPCHKKNTHKLLFHFRIWDWDNQLVNQLTLTESRLLIVCVLLRHGKKKVHNNVLVLKRFISFWRDIDATIRCWHVGEDWIPRETRKWGPRGGRVQQRTQRWSLHRLRSIKSISLDKEEWYTREILGKQISKNKGRNPEEGDVS